MNKQHHILIVDDDHAHRELLSLTLTNEGYKTSSAAKAETALKRVVKHGFSVALVDLKLMDINGLELIGEIKTLSPQTECIIITGFPTKETAIEAINMGAYSYLQKPVDTPELILTIQRAIEKNEVAAALRESEEKYRLVVENSIEGIAVVQDGLICFTNPGVVKLLVHSKEELIHKPFIELVHPEDREIIVERHKKRLKGEEVPQSYQVRLIDKAGSTKWVEVNVVMIEWEGNTATLAFVNDITERSKAEEELRDSEEKYRTILENIEDGYFEVDLAGNFTFFNDSVHEMIDYPKDEVMGMNYKEYMDADNAQKVYKAYNRVYRTGEPVKGFGWELVTKDGTKKFVESSISLIKNQETGPFGFSGIVRDITERKQAEKLQDAVYQIAQAPTKSQSLADLYGSIHEIIQSVMPAHNFYIALYDEDKDLVSYPYYMDEVDDPPPPEKPGKSQTGYILRSGQSLLSDLATLEELQIRGEAELVGAPSPIWLGVPLTIEGKTIGVMAVQHYTDPEAYGEREQRMLEYVSSQVARAIERTLAEEAIRESEEKYRTILENIEEGYFEVDLAGNFTFFNDSIHEMLGYSTDETMGMNNRQYMDTENEKKVFEAFNSVYKTGKPIKGVDWELITKDGSKKYVEASVNLITNQKNEPLGFRGIVRDITERKRADEALRESEEKYRTILENMEEGYFEVDLDGNFTFFNDSTVRTIGFPKEKMMGLHYIEYLDTNNARKVLKAFNQVYKTGEPSKMFDWELTTKRGDKVYVEASVSLMNNLEGEPVGFRGIVRDISERKQAEQLQDAVYQIAQAAQTTQSLDDLFQAIHETIQGVMSAQNFYIALYNEKEDLITFPYFIDAVDDPPLPTELGKSLTEYVLRTGETLLCDLDKHDELERLGEVELLGTPSPIWLGAPLIIEGRSIGAMVVQHYSNANVFSEREQRILEFVSSQVARAIERKQAEDTLRESEERYRAVVEDQTEMICRYSIDGTLSFANDAYCKYMGKEREELIGRNFLDIISVDSRDFLKQKLASLGIDNPFVSYEYQVKKPDGEEIWEFWTDRALYDENGQFVEYQSVGQDITERKKAEEEIWKLNQELEQRVLNRTAQLETSNEELEAFSYSVSHDLRAPLRAIHGFSEILLEDFADTLDDEGKGYLDRILVNSQKMENLIDDLLALSLLGRRDLNPKTIDVTALVKVVFNELTEGVINRKIDFIVAECLSIEADEPLVEVMLTNLISNAIKFTRDRKKTIIEFGCLKDQKKLIYYLKDNGIGFNVANAKNLFSPFQRLHPDRNFEGTGIGLAIVQRIIQRHGGQVWAEAKVNKGATFFFTI